MDRMIPGDGQYVGCRVSDVVLHGLRRGYHVPVPVGRCGDAKSAGGDGDEGYACGGEVYD